MLKRITLISFLILLTFACYFPVLNNQYVHWDDEAHFLNNALIQSININNIKNIFSQHVLQQYIPLTTLSFAIEYHFFKHNFFIYHLTNLLLHVLVVLLSTIFLSRLKISFRVIGITVILFTVHPMHVESVAWISERKDVLYSFFYMLALLNYWSFLNSQKNRYYYLSFISGILSLLAKPMAISLPLILLLLDWFHHSRLSKKDILNKIPFIILVIPMIIFLSQHNPQTLGIDKDLLKAILIFIWTFSFYLMKFLIPFELIPLYQIPVPISLSNRGYIFAILIFMLFIFIILKLRKNRQAMFAVLFYLFSIFFLFRFNKMPYLNVVADRFIYLPSLGLCLLIGLGIDQIYLRFSKLNLLKMAFTGGILIMIGALSFKTHSQIHIWKNNFTLWDHQIKFGLPNAQAFNQRALEFYDRKEYSQAIHDLNQAIKTDSKYSDSYVNRSLVYRALKEYSSALNDINTAIQLNPDFPDNYFNRGIILIESGNSEDAIKDFNKVLSFKPNDFEGHRQLGEICLVQNKLEEAMIHFQKAVSINPSSFESFNSLGLIAINQQKYELAKKFFIDSLKINPSNTPALNNLGALYLREENWREAFKIFNKIIEFNPDHFAAYNNRGLIYFKEGNFKLALEDFNKVLSLNPQNPEALTNRQTVLKKMNN